MYVDGQPVPHNPLELDFSKDQYIRAYQTLFVGTDRMGQDRVLSQEKTTSPYFQGVYSRDTLPPLQENMCAIVNSDGSSQPGTHCKKFVRESDLKRHRDSVHSTEKITRKFCDTSFTRKDNLSKHLNNKRCESWRKKREKERMDLSISSRKKKTHLSTSAENSTADPENIFLPPKERTRVLFKKHIKLLIFPITIAHWG
ncbi:hypothetical protein TNCV_2384641 [Trichonephila clavipes]|nr:hypothetical protein TNCV_2384641 [Trichonephila clavipes]